MEAELRGRTGSDFTINMEHNLLAIASQSNKESDREEHGYVIGSGATAPSYCTVHITGRPEYVSMSPAIQSAYCT